MDGHWDASGDWGGLIFVPSVDELQEFKIQTNTFSPQYGWSMGNAVNVVTKSGTSSLHGGVFEFLRNGHLDANNFFNNRNRIPRPLVHRNQFGFNLGGPLWIPGVYEQKDRTFIFGSFEGLRQQTPLTATQTVPTAAQRLGDFSSTLNANGSQAVIYNPFSTRQVNGGFVRDVFNGNQIPSYMLDPVAKSLMSYFPAPTGPGLGPAGQQNYVAALALPLDSDGYTVRVDHNLTATQRLFARWSQKRGFIQGVGAFLGANNPAGPGTGEYDPRFDIGLGYSYVLTPSTLLNATLGWGRWVLRTQPQGVPFQPSTLHLPGILDNFGAPGGFPTITTDTVGLGSGPLVRVPREARTYALDATHSHGRHTFSAGFEAIDFRVNTDTSSVASFNFPRSFTQGPDPTKASSSTGSGIASLLLGTGNTGGITLAANAAYQKTFYGWYLNDDFRWRSNLTLNLGVRYDYQTAPTDRFDRLVSWSNQRNSISDAVGLSLIGGLQHTGGANSRGVYDPQGTNFAPRVGLTWSPLNRLVVRSGFGLFYMPAMEVGLNPFSVSEGLTLNGFSQTTPYVGTLDNITPHDLLSNPFPNGLLLPPGRAPGDRTDLGLTVSAVDRNHPTPYLEQWMFGLQYQADANTLLEADYVGNHGVKLPFGYFQLNQLPPQALSLGNALLQQVPNPFFGLIPAGILSGPTVAYGQLLRPYPQFDSVYSIQPPAGMSNYNALEISASRRFRQGLQFQVSFTASKALTNTEGPEGSITQNGSTVIRSYYDISSEKSLMNNDIPRSLVINYIYELPVGRGKRLVPGSPVVNSVAGGWQIAGISTFKSGFPLSIVDGTNNTFSFGPGPGGNNQRPTIVGNPVLSEPTVTRWFNTLAFAHPAPFTFGNAPRTMPNLRSQGVNNFDFSVQKQWRVWGEASKLQFRSEFFNLFNRAAFYQPNIVYGSPAFGQIGQAYPARSIQLGLKLNW